jgi:hypothetical protein
VIFENTHLSVIEQTKLHAKHRKQENELLYKIFAQCELFYDGEQERYVKKIGEETDLDYQSRPKLVVNFTQAIADRRSSVYENQATRSISQVGEEVSTMLEELWQDSHPQFQEVDLQSELTSYGCMRIFWDDEKQTMQYIPYSALNTFPMVNDQTGEVIGICLSWMKEVVKTDGSVDTKTYRQIWTDTEFQEMLDEEPIATEENPTGSPVEHNLGCLPFVFFFAKERKRNYYTLPPIWNVVVQNDQINNLLSDLRFICHYQSFGQLILTDPDFDRRGNVITDGVRVGPRKILTVPKDGKAEFISPDAKIAEMLEFIEFMIDKMYTTAQVPKVTLAPSPTVASGVSLIVQWYPLNGLLNTKRSSFRSAEQELVEKTITVFKNAKGQTGEIGDFTFQLNFDEGTIPTDPKDQMEVDTFELDLGIISVVDLLKRNDPDLTDEDAMKQIVKNTTINRTVSEIRVKLSDGEASAVEEKIAQTFGTQNPPEDQTPPHGEDED